MNVMNLFFNGKVVSESMEKILMPKQPKTIISFLAVLIFISLTTFATVALANQSTIKVDASVVNIRTGPGLSYDIMTQVVGGEKVNVIAEENEWYKIRMSNDQIGWVASWLIGNTEISAASNKIGTVTGEPVNIRSEGHSNAEIIGTVAKGTELTVLFQQGGWTQIQYNGQVAWISSELIEVTTPTKETAPSSVATKTNSEAPIETITIRSDGTNIRSGPSVDKSVVIKASKGDSFTYLSTEGDWYQIQAADGQTGYVANWVVDLSADKTAAPTANITSLAEATIVIDAGHGGEDPGAPGGTYNEKEATLKTAKLLAERLKRAGANVVLTRSSDTSVSLNQRVVTSNQAAADVFISIHYDSTETPNEISGTTTYYYHEKDKGLANQINAQLEQNGPLPNNGVRFGDYYVTRENTRPAVLLELGYLNHYIDRSTINTDSYRQSVVESIYQALDHYFAP
ncbi:MULTISPECIES: N-acetylmuramoyl-L-alanine amidase [Carnobacterium]|uniref:N-acetylmuramoyl-L-alanine amidase n=1 Tax=Carnobacterium antarcticum TaxID=2126436 RepID=A0ABW4NRP2_9LACT|nr:MULTISPECIES: N-acetylmuramoyl-L-alanine amidase [unclassified Carnobacterium]ALV21185.1 N-acetylmuramoyl-L-alanine amidase [Carnobacterium sp. CP1]